MAKEPAAKKKKVPTGAARPVTPAKIGRPCSYTDEIGAEICARLALGESLRTICNDDHMPGAATVFLWLGDESKKPFLEQYMRARDAQADFYAESVIDISDEEVTMIKRSKHDRNAPPEDEDEIEVVFDATAVARNRLRVDARKWYASKLAPKKYGDKVTQELTGANGGPIDQSITVSFVRPTTSSGE